MCISCVCVCTVGADCWQLVAEALPSPCGHHQEQIFARQSEVHGLQLQWSERGEMELVLQVLLQIFRPWKIYQTFKVTYYAKSTFSCLLYINMWKEILKVSGKRFPLFLS